MFGRKGYVSVSRSSLLPSEQDEEDTVELQSAMMLDEHKPVSQTWVEFSTFEKYLFAMTLSAFLSIAGVALWYYVTLYLHSRDNPSMSITKEHFPSGEISPFNITFFPQIALNLKALWTEKMQPSCDIQGKTRDSAVSFPPCIATLYASPATSSAGYQGFFSGCESLPWLNKSSAAYHRLLVQEIEYYANSTSGSTNGTAVGTSVPVER